VTDAKKKFKNRLGKSRACVPLRRSCIPLQKKIKSVPPLKSKHFSMNNYLLIVVAICIFVVVV
jgi:hypothetical protein